MSVTREKQRLRKEMLNLRPDAATPQANDRILQTLLKTKAYQTSDLVLCYVSVKTEVDTRAFLEHCFRSQKRIAVPKCYENGLMRFFEVRALCELQNGAMDIPEPAETATQAVPTQRTLCVVPGLAFDRAGFRVGYGGGYYDRFLADFPGESIGLCYDDCLFDHLPKDSYDSRVKQLITETQFFCTTTKEEAYG